MAHYKLLAGLGNPGAKYESTRHNIGFVLADRLAGDRATWRQQCGVLLADASVGDTRLLIAKPQSFMNLSGEPLRRLCEFYKIAANEVIAVHDEIDIPLGAMRIKNDGGDGGHNGIRSLIEHLGANDFTRIRLGVGRPPDPRWEVSDWVLGRFTAEEQVVVQEMLTRGALAVEELVARGVKSAQNRFNS